MWRRDGASEDLRARGPSVAAAEADHPGVVEILDLWGAVDEEQLPVEDVTDLEMAGEALRRLRHELAAENDADVVVVEGGDLPGGAAEGPGAAAVLSRHVAPQRAIGHLTEAPGRFRSGEEDVVAGVGVGHPGHANDGEELHLVAVEVDDPRLALHRRRQLERADGAPHDAPAL